MQVEEAEFATAPLVDMFAGPVTISKGPCLREADLTRADLQGKDLVKADLTGATLRGANLADADLRLANLEGADLSDANLTGANVRGANLAKANLNGAVLRDVKTGSELYDPGEFGTGVPLGDRASRPRDNVVLSVSAPDVVRRGESFTCKFMAYLQGLADQVEKLVGGVKNIRESVLSPDALWPVGASVIVELSVDQEEKRVTRTHQFEWNGSLEVVDLELTIDVLPPKGVAFIFIRVSVGDFRVAAMRLSLRIMDDGRETATSRSQTVKCVSAARAFASYCSQDRPRVLDRVASIRTVTGMNVFMDCLSIRPSERWKPKLRNEILACNLFLLFWSQAASQSEWVTWEWKTAVREKDEDSIQIHPLDNARDAPAPKELEHLHFSDPYMDIRSVSARRSTLDS